MIELICIGTLITIVIIISDRKKSKKYRKKHKTPKQKGIEGENVISNIIQYAPMYKKIVRNAYIDMNENKKTEIDIIAISTKGIYVIESKNYEGWILGDEKSNQWCQNIYNKKSYFYNPIKQNQTHIKSINKILQLDEKMYESLIIFNKSEIKKMFVSSSRTYVMNIQKFRFYMSQQDKLQDKITKEEVDRIYNILQKYTQITEEEKIRQIMQNQNKI